MSDTLGITLSIDGGRSRERAGRIERAQLVLVMECSRPTALPARYSLSNLAVVRLGRGHHRTGERTPGDDGGELRITVPDRWMSSRHARIDYSFGRWVLHDEGSKNGTLVNGQLIQRAVLGDGDVVELGHTLFRYRERVAMTEDDPLDLDLEAHPPDERGLATLIPPLGHELDKLRQVAGSVIPVLLQGESGSGKEVLARAIHRQSNRRGDFVAVNCGAIPANLVESELFGHKKGAFSGATDDRTGLVRTADGGTLFLDEIGDLPAGSQAALLRVLQEREVMPVGAARPVPVDLRVVAATHRDLDALVARGAFRHDLLARLSGFRIQAAPLRQRLDDLGVLVASLLSRAGGQHPGFEPDAARLMLAYSWPLNVRELEQCLATSALLAGADPVASTHLPEPVRTGRAPQPAVPVIAPTPELDDTDRELRDQIVAHLRQHAGNVSAVARDMGKDRKQIQRWLKRLAIDPDTYRP
jgi:sigma-54 dependent transcriptional regulator, acetoin dehydrogenase operon transcriptional activator AcoR